MQGVYVPITSVRQALCAFTDAAVILASFVAATFIRFRGEIDEFYEYEHFLTKAILNTFLLSLCLYYSDLYEDATIRRPLDIFLRLGRAFLVGAAVLTLTFYLMPSLKVGRGILTLYMPIAFLGVSLWRFAFFWVADNEAFRDRVLLLGTGQSARQIAEEVMAGGRARRGFRIVGFLGEHRAEVGRRLVNPSILGTIDDLERLVQELRVNLVVVALDDRRGKLPVDNLLRCRMAGVRVEEATAFFEEMTGKILVKNLRPSWLVFSEGFRKPRLLRNTKRTVEFLVAAMFLILVAPLLAFLAVLIKLDSRGPVFYRQERVGEKGSPFLLFKLRTMRADAEKATGPVWAAEGKDPRVTSLGRWLRKLRLDELPQLLNILRGEMSFVGPRPERPNFVEMLRKIIPFYDERHSVLPGITGWAQIKFSYGSTIEDAEEKLQFDLYYIKHMSPLFDLAIVLDTLKVMVVGKGAR